MSGPEIRSADADVHHIGDGFAAESGMRTVQKGSGKGFHPVEYLMYIGQHIHAIYSDSRSV